MTMAEEHSIVKGARFSVVYRVNVTKEAVVEGVYGGMAAMGTETALVFETADGISFINSNAIVAVNQTEAAPEEPRKGPGEDRALYG